jgi:voltage-gated potassium channel
MKQFSSLRLDQPTLWTGLILSIPAFYLILSGPDSFYRLAGQILYTIVAILLGAHLFPLQGADTSHRVHKWRFADIAILIGTIASVWPSEPPWTSFEWVLRLAYCGVVFIRLATLVAKYIAPNRLLQICGLSLLMLAIAGAGFFWLEPKVRTYADGVWLAFTTGATVGYGDLVPTTPASRIFAVFIVLLGYALLSIVTASIAAALVGEDEKHLRQELHADMRLLRKEIAALRVELDSVRNNVRSAPKAGEEGTDE